MVYRKNIRHIPLVHLNLIGTTRGNFANQVLLERQKSAASQIFYRSTDR